MIIQQASLLELFYLDWLVMKLMKAGLGVVLPILFPTQR